MKNDHSRKGFPYLYVVLVGTKQDSSPINKTMSPPRHSKTTIHHKPLVDDLWLLYSLEIKHGEATMSQWIGLKKGPWTPEEDKKLRDYIESNGHHGSWRLLPKLADLNRCGKSCRLRWTNYLRPDIKRGAFTEEEDKLIIQLHSVLGNRWSTIATRLPGRSDNEIKNYWNTHLRKKLLQMGIDPVTHQPRADLNRLATLLNLMAGAKLGSLTSSLGSSLQLQADAAHLMKLQLVQKLVQLLTCGPTQDLDLMGLYGSSLSRQLSGLGNGSLIPQSSVPMLSGLSDQGLQHLANKLPPLPESSISADGEVTLAPAPAPSPSPTDDLSSDSVVTNKEWGTNSCIFPTSNSTPFLVSASPESISKSESIPLEGSAETPVSTHFETWDALNLDGLDNDLPWKEILDQMSPWMEPQEHTGVHLLT